jgi:hypothetical protein
MAHANLKLMLRGSGSSCQISSGRVSRASSQGQQILLPFLQGQLANNLCADLGSLALEIHRWEQQIATDG